MLRVNCWSNKSIRRCGREKFAFLLSELHHADSADFGSQIDMSVVSKWYQNEEEVQQTSCSQIFEMFTLYAGCVDVPAILNEYSWCQFDGNVAPSLWECSHFLLPRTSENKVPSKWKHRFEMSTFPACRFASNLHILYDQIHENTSIHWRHDGFAKRQWFVHQQLLFDLLWTA